ncbi:16S rRNA (adenine(1518)-N(6)/adenine(1519)-N(6))-dimethyltransferase RsmA [Acidicapsa ligni]|uniref:16S rRNA (adenine(1518)-N(6)/adenine(1519)-N(6))- dimethyltransferase RsmA n=1 Tax=Acidicapsa ligni TaxID=542300 RepID=UPI0021E0EF42|nr:16S rRNA (adenine(1518)-N(6)/adenine(1519)-N(6))-dimethyltransferase RsmA [Acidicapsa ligni]
MPTKPKLGQNFLRDPQAIQRIVAALGNLSSRTVVEIGPGKGAITEALASRAGHLIAIELDRELAWNLQERFSPEKGVSNVSVVRKDVLEFDFAAAAKEAGQPLLVVGNLPYYITSPILLRLAAQASSLERAVLMVQREVADRVTADHGSRDYGLLSATLQLYGPAENLFTLPPEAFAPPPEVHSTVFRWSFVPTFAQLGVTEAPFISFLKQCFAQKRKTLSNNLRAAGFTADAIAKAYTSAEVPAQVRAEALPIDKFAAIWRTLVEG